MSEQDDQLQVLIDFYRAGWYDGVTSGIGALYMRRTDQLGEAYRRGFSQGQKDSQVCWQRANEEARALLRGDLPFEVKP